MPITGVSPRSALPAKVIPGCFKGFDLGVKRLGWDSGS